MFHVEQNETHIEVVDHFLTKETFKIQKTLLPGLLQTHPSPSKNEIQKYYSSDKSFLMTQLALALFTLYIG
tara:strand:+ start:106 stop:318 length:213 start_codon:yes stop_codon:yes gene_type:complete